MTNNTSAIKVNCDVFWAFTNKPSDLSQKYELTLCNLSEIAKTNLEGIGIEVRNREDKPEQGYFIVCKSTLPIRAQTRDGAPIEDIIGNGSKAIATISSYEWKYQKKTGVSPSLKNLVITDLKQMEGRDNEDDGEVY